MHVISRKRLNDFAAIHPTSKEPLARWYRLIKSGRFDHFSDLRATFPHADQVGKLTVFNVAGNHFRLIAAIHYNRKKVYVRAILTHAEYDENFWKE